MMHTYLSVTIILSYVSVVVDTVHFSSCQIFLHYLSQNLWKMYDQHLPREASPLNTM